MFEPVRGGTRGGQAEFKWSDVSADKDREHYLGHSINAPTGRWQKNKDIHWYSREKEATQAEKDAEIHRIKEMEANALAVALGFEPAQNDSSKAATGTTVNSLAEQQPKLELGEAALTVAQEKEEKRRRKEQKKAEKREKKLAKLERRARDRGEDLDSYERRLIRSRSRSRSPRRRDSDRSRSPRRRSPERHYSPRRPSSPNHGRTSSYHPDRRSAEEYDAEERERERQRDRRRWELNARRELPSRYR